MKRKSKRRQVPIMLLWSKREQLRFIDAIERLVSIVGDLEILIAARKRTAKPKAHAAPVGGNGS